MDEQKIQLRKIRDFSDVLSDTFQFLRQEWKPLGKAFLLIAGIFLLAISILNGFYQTNIFSSFQQIETGNTANPFSAFDRVFTPTYFLLILVGVLAIVSMNVVVASYFKLYEAGIVSPSVVQVWDVFKKYFLKCFFYYIPLILLLLIGFVLCFVPGIYLWVVLTPFSFVVVTEDLSFSDAFNRCFQIIKQNFWLSFGIYIVIYLIVAFSSGIIGLAAGVVTGFMSYFTTKDTASSVGLATSVLNVFSYLFYIIFFAAAGLQYFSLAEKTDGTGIAQRIENIGKQETPNSGIEEQF